MTRATPKSLSRDLRDFADEATGHLKDAARKTGTEASAPSSDRPGPSPAPRIA